MSDAPLVSIVLPVHNGERYLREALESCRAQTYPHWELIAVDDCSTDETPDILRNYASQEPRIRLLRNPQNLRLPKSLNAGFAESRGAILTWTSDDNNFLPDALAVMVRTLQEHPSAMMVYSAQDFIDPDGRVLYRQEAAPPENLCHFNVVNASFAYRRGVWTTLGGYDPQFELVEDWEYWLRIAEVYELRPIPNCLYQYRQHPGTLTQRAGDVRWRAVERLLETYLPRLRRKWPAGYARGFVRLSDERWRRDDRRTAWCYWRRSLQTPGFSTVFAHWRILLPLLLGKRIYFGLRSRAKFLDYSMERSLAV